MSLEERLREGLRRASAAVEPDVTRELRVVRRRARRLIIGQRVATAVVAAAVLAGAVIFLPRLADLVRGLREHPATRPAPAALAGSYRADLRGAGGAVAGRGLAGAWALTLRADGSIVWNPPPGARVVEGEPRDTYQASGTSIVTDLFSATLCRGDGVGTYLWSRAGATLTFRVVRDRCGLRRAILTSAPWRSG
jgi:hypothetical protein